MNLRRSLHTNKGYTLIELMITLLIFAIITMFGVPAFYDFIEQSRAKSQMVKAANFLRSAQEIATASNRIVYVYTTGYFDYDNHKKDYWYQNWVMSFKPMGEKYTNNLKEIDKALESQITKGTPNPNYLISLQEVFRSNSNYKLLISGSNKPEYLIFMPSGAITLPTFIVEDSKSHNNTANTTSAMTLGVLAGCRTAGGNTIDSINYTFNKSILNDSIFEESAFTPIICNSDHIQ